MLSTVAVISLRAYIFLSAGTRCPDWDVTAKPAFFTMPMNSSWESSVRYPGIDSSLSMVPPVKPSPRPDILGTYTPHEAHTAATTRVVLSPTPPVLCLSAQRPISLSRSYTSPEYIMAPVSCMVSSKSMPFMQTAIRNAAICTSGTSPRVKPSVMKSISSAESFSPRLFLLMISYMVILS